MMGDGLAFLWAAIAVLLVALLSVVALMIHSNNQAKQHCRNSGGTVLYTHSRNGWICLPSNVKEG